MSNRHLVNQLSMLPAELRAALEIEVLRPDTDIAGNGALSIADTLGALELLSTAGLPNGALAYVVEVDDLYALDTVNSHVADDPVLIEAADAGGFWLSRFQGRWDDAQGDVQQGNAAGVLTNESFRDTDFRMAFFRHDQQDDLSFRYQFPHRWRYDTAVVPHLHLLPMADPAADEDAYFDGYYTWSRVGQLAVPALASWTPFTATVTISPGDQYVQRVASLGSITPPAWVRESSLLMLHFQRNATHVNDTYDTAKDHGTPAANLGVLSADVHYRLAHSGTLTQLPTEG